MFRRKIPCYVLIFDQLDIIKSSLNFLSKYSNRLDLIVIENPSPNTAKIKKLVDSLGQSGLVKRYYLFDKNITGNAYDTVLTKELDEIKKSPFVLITDGDLMADNPGWLDEEISILKKHKGVFACGVSLDMSNLPLASFPSAKNWIPKDIAEHKDYFEALTGGHLLLVRGKEFYDFMKWKDKNNLYFVDGFMHKYCYEILNKRWSRTKKSKARHLTWDLYLDKDHAYTKLKTEKSFHETWYHRRGASYSLTNY